MVLTPRGRGRLVDRFRSLVGAVDELVDSKTEGTGETEAVLELDMTNEANGEE